MSKKNNECCDKKASKICYVGGQALMEGIMMRAKNGYAQVVRNSKGQMVLSRTPIEPAAKNHSFLSWPVVRGSVRLIDSLVIGMKALSDSAEIAIDGIEETEKEKARREKKEKKRAEKLEKKGKSVQNNNKENKENDGWILALSLVLSLAFSVCLFMLLPNFIADLIIPQTWPRIIYNLVEAIIRIGIFLLYMFGVSRLKDIKRVFMYHGAEHKTIHCFEHDEELTVENVRKYSKHHPRCGTAFLFVIMIVSILVYSLMPRFGLRILNILVRLVFLPVIAGIAYEFNRFAGRSEGWVAKVLRAPGMAMQRFTTFEPEDDMIECAILALKEALKLDDVPNYSFAEKLKMDPTPVDKDGKKAEEKTDDSEEKKSDGENDDFSANGCEDNT